MKRSGRIGVVASIVWFGAVFLMTENPIAKTFETTGSVAGIDRPLMCWRCGGVYLGDALNALLAGRTMIGALALGIPGIRRA